MLTVHSLKSACPQCRRSVAGTVSTVLRHAQSSSHSFVIPLRRQPTFSQAGRHEFSTSCRLNEETIPRPSPAASNKSITSDSHPDSHPYSAPDSIASPLPSTTPKEIEKVVRGAKELFHDTLPEGYLTHDEYRVYERLYGRPLRETRPEDVGIPTHEDVGEDPEELNRKRLQSELMANLGKTRHESYLESIGDDIRDEDGDETLARYEEDDLSSGKVGGGRELDGNEEGDFETKSRPSFIDIIAKSPREHEALRRLEAKHREEKIKRTEAKAERERRLAEEERVAAEVEEDAAAAAIKADIAMADREFGLITEQESVVDDEDEDEYKSLPLPVEFDYDAETPSTHRYHKYTLLGQSRTSPAVVSLPMHSVETPLALLLKRSDIKHVKKAAEDGFGGPGLPLGPATPASMRTGRMDEHGLQAVQYRMSEIEADAFLAGFYAPAYASAINVLAESRRRLGSDWIRRLVDRDTSEGPRVLDIGMAGAGLAAWNEVAAAEWDVMRHEGRVRWSNPRLPPVRGTIIVGAATLRQRLARIFHDTTFLPRLPDYAHLSPPTALDAPVVPQSRKLYDIVIAGHQFLPTEDGHRRKAVLNQLWGVLNPDGGLLVVIEKANPRGFEAVAEVRSQLLKSYVLSPGEKPPNEDKETDPAWERVREPALIVAPCTNHLVCPMYTIPGRMHGRKDFCHFGQRYAMPPWLRRIMLAKTRNESEVQFSYLALQRGVQAELLHPQLASQRAFAGYDDSPAVGTGIRGGGGDSDEEYNAVPTSHPSYPPHPDPLSLPRAILPPLKHKGHVTLDVCTPDAKIERWLIPRSYGRQAYHDARKSRWGDLWALGAKTRTPRNLRLGRHEATKGQARNKLGKAPAPERRTKGGRKPPRALRDEVRRMQESLGNVPVEGEQEKKVVEMDDEDEEEMGGRGRGGRGSRGGRGRSMSRRSGGRTSQYSDYDEEEDDDEDDDDETYDDIEGTEEDDRRRERRELAAEDAEIERRLRKREKKAEKLRKQAERAERAQRAELADMAEMARQANVQGKVEGMVATGTDARDDGKTGRMHE